MSAFVMDNNTSENVGVDGNDHLDVEGVPDDVSSESDDSM